MDKRAVSSAVIRRMPKYYRFLDELKANHVFKVSSRTMAECLGLTASQIRQDFNCFGGFGQQGVGYNVETLHAAIGEIIGVNKMHSAVVIGVGNIGRALINNFDFAACGFKLLAGFDNDESIIGSRINDVEILSMAKLSAFCRDERIDVAVLTLPKHFAPSIAENLMHIGIRGIWNFTNIDLHMNERLVKVENVHFADSLMTLCFNISCD